MRGQRVSTIACLGLALLGLISAGCPTPTTGGGGIDNGTTGNGNDNVNGNDNANVNDNVNTNVNDNSGGGLPIADAGPDQAVAGGALVTLDGSGSEGQDPAALVLSWVQTAGTPVDLVDAGTASPSFTAPNTDETLTFSLALDDGAGSKALDTVDVVVTPTSAMLFVVNNNSPMTSYDGAALLDGEIAPTNRLNNGVTTGLFQPRSIVVTRSDRLLISRNNGGIIVYEDARTVDGAAPGVEVNGDLTLLHAPISFAYDEVNDRLFVGDSNADNGILVFDDVSGAEFAGDIAPMRMFGPDDRLPFPGAGVSTSLVMTVDAMDLDSRGYLYVSDTSGQNVNKSRMLVFASAATDDGLAVVSQSFTSAWGGIEDFVVDDNGALYVVDSTANICVFKDVTNLTLDADDFVEPDAIVTVGVSLADLQGIVVDSNGTAYVADRENHAIYVIDDLVNVTSGTVTPNRTLEGSDTRLSAPRQMFLLER